MTPVPGLVLAREPCTRESWCVLHGPSGVAIICDLAGHATAELAAEALGRLGLDWSMSARQLLDAADLLCSVDGDVERIAERFGGTTLADQAVYAL